MGCSLVTWLVYFVGVESSLFLPCVQIKACPALGNHLVHRDSPKIFWFAIDVQDRDGR